MSTTHPRDDRDDRKKRGLWWLLALALLVALAIILLAKSCGGDDSDSNGGAGGSAGAGSIVAGDQDMIGQAKAGSLSGLDGKDVSANAVKVQSVVNKTGFWVGTSETDRVFVEIEGEGGAEVDVQAGDTVSFDGQIEKNIEAETYGLRAENGAAQFKEQGYHVRVDAADVETG